MRDLIVHSLEDDKATNIVIINLNGKSSIADYMIVASGTSSRQIGSMAQHLRDKMKENSIHDVHSEGEAVGDWVLIDAHDVIVHLFKPETREFYQIEKMWDIDPEDDFLDAPEFSPTEGDQQDHAHMAERHRSSPT